MAAVALAALLGACEVEWGGVQVKAGEPEFGEPPASLEALKDTAAELAPLALPSGPLLFHVRRSDESGRATIAPVAELGEEGLRLVEPLPAERAEEYSAEFIARYYAKDAAYTLTRDGARVGTFYVGAPAVSGSGACMELGATGVVELRMPADTLSEFLAWPPGARAARERFEAPPYREDMVALSQVLARRGVTDAGVGGRWRFQAPADLRAVHAGEGRLGFAATYMVGDSLGQGSPVDSAGMAFVVADHSPAVGYIPLYVDASWYGAGDKRALRWIDAEDLVGDADPEWLLRAYGDGGSWYEMIGMRGDGYADLWSSRRPQCEAQTPAPLVPPGEQ